MPLFSSSRLPLRTFDVLFSRSISPSTGWSAPARRAFSAPHSPPSRGNDLFNYTSGRWIVNDAHRLAERRRVFNVNGLRRLAAQSVGRNYDDVVDLVKLAEGGFNRIFLITMRDGFKMVARIPYPATTPKYFAVASEVATMDLLRSSGLPIPRIYGYSPDPNNAAETEYIFMEFVQGTDLSDVWFDLGEDEIISLSREIAELEAKAMSITFPAGGSLYYAKDLDTQVSGTPNMPLEDTPFCVGPDTRISLWLGRRSELDVDRGPYKSTEAALKSGANKELAYLDRFGRPLLPLHAFRREAYHYRKQPPSDHVENLNRYLLIATSLIPRSQELNRFCIRHPDLLPGNIIVSRSSDSDLHIVSLLDWQHTSILPMFILAGIPTGLQNYDDPVSQSMTRPSLPDDFDDLGEARQNFEKELYRRRLVHYHYLKNTKECNPVLYAAMLDPMIQIRRRLFYQASEMWEGETLALKVALIEATRNWDALTEGGAPCSVAFDAEDVHKTMELEKVQREAEEGLGLFKNIIGYGSETWVSPERYKEAIALTLRLKKAWLADSEGQESADDEVHWPLGDTNEEDYL